jgi:hypothetical protein
MYAGAVDQCIDDGRADVSECGVGLQFLFVFGLRFEVDVGTLCSGVV